MGMRILSDVEGGIQRRAATADRHDNTQHHGDSSHPAPLIVCEPQIVASPIGVPRTPLKVVNPGFTIESIFYKTIWGWRPAGAGAQWPCIREQVLHRNSQRGRKRRRS